MLMSVTLTTTQQKCYRFLVLIQLLETLFFLLLYFAIANPLLQVKNARGIFFYLYPLSDNSIALEIFTYILAYRDFPLLCFFSLFSRDHRGSFFSSYARDFSVIIPATYTGERFFCALLILWTLPSHAGWCLKGFSVTIPIYRVTVLYLMRFACTLYRLSWTLIRTALVTLFYFSCLANF